MVIDTEGLTSLEANALMGTPQLDRWAIRPRTPAKISLGDFRPGEERFEAS